MIEFDSIPGSKIHPEWTLEPVSGQQGSESLVVRMVKRDGSRAFKPMPIAAFRGQGAVMIHDPQTGELLWKPPAVPLSPEVTSNMVAQGQDVPFYQSGAEGQQGVQGMPPALSWFTGKKGLFLGLGALAGLTAVTVWYFKRKE